MDSLKKHLGPIFVVIILLGLYFYHRDVFFIEILAYGLFIKLILSSFIKGGLRKILAIAIWTAFIVLTGLTFYVNHYLPRGEFHATGTNSCEFSDTTPCEEIYYEDLSRLNIPNWANFFRNDNWIPLWGGLLFTGVLISSKNNENT